MREKDNAARIKEKMRRSHRHPQGSESQMKEKSVSRLGIKPRSLDLCPVALLIMLSKPTPWPYHSTSFSSQCEQRHHCHLSDDLGLIPSRDTDFCFVWLSLPRGCLWLPLILSLILPAWSLSLNHYHYYCLFFFVLILIRCLFLPCEG